MLQTFLKLHNGHERNSFSAHESRDAIVAVGSSPELVVCLMSTANKQ